MRYASWALRPQDAEAAREVERGGISPLAAAVLAARGFHTAEEVERFLSADPAGLEDPLSLPDMAAAVARIEAALAGGERIAVYGDYDVDGITATCVLTAYLRGRGAHCEYYIPDRIEEGYGVNKEAVDLLRGHGVTLLITVDCGVTAVETVAYARGLGMDVVITDHHECQAELPRAAAVVNPRRPGAHDTGLAGVGVALKLTLALAPPAERESVFSAGVDLAALGTVADVVRLTGENRILVSCGLKALTRSPRTGVRALLREANLEGKSITAVSIGYVLAPRINAAGRMGRAEIAAELLLSEEEGHAARLAAELCALNRERQRIEQAIFQEAVKRIEQSGGPGSAIVLADDAWHQGVVGIVASRLCERFFRPVLMICTSGDKGKGSCRSWGGVNIYEILASCAPLLESYGGHTLAAGFTIRREKIDEFRAAVERCAAAAGAAAADRRQLLLDAEAEAKHLTLEQVEQLSRLEPHGPENPRPLLLMREAAVQSCANVGNDRHLSLRLRQGGRSIDAIFFSATAEEQGIAVGDVLDIAFHPQINVYNGARSVQLLVTDLRAGGPGAEEERALYDAYLDSQNGAPPPPEQARALLPERPEFEAVWRYLRAAARNGVLEATADALARNIAAGRSLTPSAARTRVCLDVFDELGLLSVDRRADGRLSVSLLPERGTVKLEHSGILRRLREQAGAVQAMS